jgi:hypothetical protein
MGRWWDSFNAAQLASLILVLGDVRAREQLDQIYQLFTIEDRNAGIPTTLNA